MRTDIWREGKWVDLWSVVHLLSGVSIGLFAGLLSFDPVYLTILTIILLILYEGWEILVKIDETPTNRFMDVVVGVVGYLPAFFLIAPSLSRTSLILVFAVTLTVNIAGSAIGWRASHKAAEFEKRMQVRYANQRAKIIDRRKRLGAKFKHKPLNTENETSGELTRETTRLP